MCLIELLATQRNLFFENWRFDIARKEQTQLELDVKSFGVGLGLIKIVSVHFLICNVNDVF